jgi:general secretion pathway protein A
MFLFQRVSMYRAFYNLKSKPFEITPDPIFLWFGEKYKEALSALRYGILENKGFLLLTGDAGSGKTTLINALTENLDNAVEWAVISNPNRERLDFYNAIAKGFGIAKEFTSKVQFLIQFSSFLHKADDEHKKVLLLIDDCHRLSQDMLEELRLLSNIEKADSKLINIFFIGQREFLDMLIQPSNRAVRQRLTLKVELAPLTDAQTAEYIRQRLKVAGVEKRLFSAKAIEKIHRYSLGNPKLINIICQDALVVGNVQRKRNLDHKIIEECIHKLNLHHTPSQEDQGLAEEVYLNHFRQKCATGYAQVGTIVSRIQSLKAGRWGWLKFSMGGAALVFLAIYLWYPLDKIPRDIGGDTRKLDRKFGMKETSQVKLLSAAIPILEQNQNVINGKKITEFNPLLETVDNDNENARQRIAIPAVAVEEMRPGAGQANAGSAGDHEDTILAVHKQDSAIPRDGTAVAGEMTGKPSERVGGVDTVLASKDHVSDSFPHNTIILQLAPNSLKLTVEASQEYNRFVENLKQHPRVKLLVKGFVSSKSDSPENTTLSEERARGVQKLLIASGIPAERIQVKGMGNKEPLASNNTSDGRAKNRRVEIVMIEDGL